MTLNDRLIGLLAVLGGAAMIWASFGFREIAGQLHGSSLFPRIVGTALILTGVAIAVPAPRGETPVRLSPLLRVPCRAA